MKNKLFYRKSLSDDHSFMAELSLKLEFLRSFLNYGFSAQNKIFERNSEIQDGKNIKNSIYDY